jgi:hypothetical protein
MTMTRYMIIACALAACAPLGGGVENENEVITTVLLTFTPTSGSTVTATWDDEDGDGGTAPTIDPINLTEGDYTLTVQFQNRLVTPPEEITDEVRDEQDFHLLLFTGTAVLSPATSNATAPLVQTYSDMDGNGLPVGLTNTIVASPGAGQLTVTLRHMAPEQPPVKASDTLAIAKQSGIDALGGSTDALVDFEVTVP